MRTTILMVREGLNQSILDVHSLLSQSGRLGAGNLLLCLLLLTPFSATAGGSLGIPDTIDGYPSNVGLVILGHSTSAQGAYPAKLVSALNHAAHTADGRHY